ncbi:ABC transporter permease [Paenibacillus sp. HB172176]|uniref:ABC transporter permease n=1 Tax=Paenibacillus sp. HB172176 TaxID=2493690 RepID=UPI0014397505|nr:ABC transporter permease [Paenibacillus sp. HB172176]
MISFIGKRLILFIPTLLGVSLIVFLMLQMVPGDPVNSIVSSDATEEERALVAHELGLDKPIYLQFVYWLGHMLQGDMGNSIIKRLPVSDLLLPAVWNTMILALASAAVSFGLGLLIGVYSAYRPKSVIASLFNVSSLAGIGMPNFWVALILIGIFSVSLGWLPSSGMTGVGGGGPLDLLKHLILPTLAASLTTLGVMTRMVRSTISGLLQQDFVFALQAKGAGSGSILRHVLKNGMPTILTVAGLQFGYLIGGSVLVETVFAWPGIGQLIYQAIGQRDFPIVQSGVLVVAITFVLINLIVDALHALLDPRVRHS